MLRSRIIPCLLIHKGGLVKTLKFKDPKYVGDPINAVRTFNEKLADELIVIDIDASKNGSEPNLEMIEKFAAEARMPICYVGGVKNINQVKEIIGLGVEKVGISSAAIKNPTLIREASDAVGSQSVVVILDVKKKMMGYTVKINNAEEDMKIDPLILLDELIQYSPGEIVINSVDNDGVMNGYDLKLAKSVKDRVNVPVTMLGGAGSLNDISDLISKLGVVGAAAGSLFVFTGKYRAVLINYPTIDEKRRL